MNFTNEKPTSPFRAFVANENGATAIEYALIAAILSIVIVASLVAISGSLSGTFSNVSSELDAA